MNSKFKNKTKSNTLKKYMSFKISKQNISLCDASDVQSLE